MWLKLFAVSLWSGMVALDTTAALQIMISQPLVACSVTGLILGNLPMGLLVGIVFQLMWLAEIPAGATYTAEGNIGATAGTAIAILATEQTLRQSPTLALSILLALGLSLLAGEGVILIRRINGSRYGALLREEQVNFEKVTRSHLSGLALMFIMGFILTLFSSWLLGIHLLPMVVHRIPVAMDIWLQPLGSALLGLGCGVLLSLFYTRKEVASLLIGLVLGAAAIWLVAF